MTLERLSSCRYRCRFCGTYLNAWLPWAKAPNSALLLGHVGQQHLDQLRPYLRRMEAFLEKGPNPTSMSPGAIRK